MIVWIVRHGSAGSKEDWWGDDAARPLDEAGRLRSKELASLLADAGVTHLVSSPTARCIETLVPLSVALGLPVETSDALRHEATPADVFELIARSGDGAALCTHGEVMEPLLGAIGREGFTIVDRSADQLLAKGAVWRLDLDARSLELAI